MKRDAADGRAIPFCNSSPRRALFRLPAIKLGLLICFFSINEGQKTVFTQESFVARVVCTSVLFGLASCTFEQKESRSMHASNLIWIEEYDGIMAKLHCFNR